MVRSGVDQNVVDREAETTISGDYNPYLTMEFKLVSPMSNSG